MRIFLTPVDDISAQGMDYLLQVNYILETLRSQMRQLGIIILMRTLYPAKADYLFNSSEASPLSS